MQMQKAQPDRSIWLSHKVINGLTAFVPLRVNSQGRLDHDRRNGCRAGDANVRLLNNRYGHRVAQAHVHTRDRERDRHRVLHNCERVCKRKGLHRQPLIYVLQLCHLRKHDVDGRRVSSRHDLHV